MFETTVRDEVLQAVAPGTRWLSTGWNGGYVDADAAYNISVPKGWDRQDLTAYVEERLDRSGFLAEGPALLTGVDMEHVRAATLDSVTVFATVGLSNPASLPLSVPGSPEAATERDRRPSPGTVNLLVGTERALDDGALGTLLATVVEAKTGTLLQKTGFTGTTSDAVAVGTDPTGSPRQFAGSSTAVGDAARACVREAVLASLDARYPDGDLPASVQEADTGIETDRQATVFEP